MPTLYWYSWCNEISLYQKLDTITRIVFITDSWQFALSRLQFSDMLTWKSFNVTHTKYHLPDPKMSCRMTVYGDFLWVSFGVQSHKFNKYGKVTEIITWNENMEIVQALPQGLIGISNNWRTYLRVNNTIRFLAPFYRCNDITVYGGTIYLLCQSRIFLYDENSQRSIKYLDIPQNLGSATVYEKFKKIFVQDENILLFSFKLQCVYPFNFTEAGTLNLMEIMGACAGNTSMFDIHGFDNNKNMLIGDYPNGKLYIAYKYGDFVKKEIIFQQFSGRYSVMDIAIQPTFKEIWLLSPEIGLLRYTYT